MVRASKRRRVLEACALVAWSICVGLLLVWWQSDRYRVHFYVYPNDDLRVDVDSSHSMVRVQLDWLRTRSRYIPRCDFRTQLAHRTGVHCPWWGVEWARGRSEFQLVFHYGFLVVITGGATALFAWITANHFRFSLKMMLIVTTIIALVIGLASSV